MCTGQRLPENRELGALYEGLKSDHEAVSEATARELGQRAARDPWARRFLLDVARGRVAISPQSAVSAFEQLARTEPENVIALFLGGDASASPVAATALGRDPERFEKQLAAAARKPGATLRLAAVAGLAEAAAGGSPQAVEVLGGLLGDSDGQVRWAAAAALGRARAGVCAERALLWLERAIGLGDDRAVSGAAFGAAHLWRASKQKAAALLLKAARSGMPGRRAAALAMKGLPWGAARSVASVCVGALDPYVRALSAAALGRWAAQGSTTAWRELVGIAGDADPLVRAGAAEALARDPALPAGRLIERLAADSSPLVRAATAAGLARRGDEELAEVLRRLARDEAAGVRAAAITAMAKIGVQGSVREACGDLEPAVRAAAAAALARGGAEELELLLALSRDRDGVVVRSAARALGVHARSASGPVWERLIELATEGTGTSAAAEGMAAVMDREPEAPELFWRWPAGRLPADTLGRIARAAETVQVAELARAASRALEGGDDLWAALEDLAAAFLASGREGIAESSSWLAGCARAEALDEVPGLGRGPTRGMGEAISHLAAAARALDGAAQAQRRDSRKRRLARARVAIETILEHDEGQLDWLLVRRVARKWYRLVGEAEPARGAEVRARLISRSVVAMPGSALLIELANVGSGPACDISVALAGTQTTVHVPHLAQGEKTEVEVPLAMPEPGQLVVRALVQFRGGEGGEGSEVEGTVRVLKPGPVGALVNPYVVGKPLGGESAMFFGRAAEIGYVERALASGEGGSVVVLVGQRRTGKTSLLRRLEAHLASGYRPAFLDVQGMLVSDTEDFFRELARGALGRADAVPMLADGRGWSNGGSTGPEMVREVAARSDRPMVLLLDEFDDLEEKVHTGRLSPEVFGQLRNLIQHSENLNLVLSGTHRLEAVGGEHWSFLLNLATYKKVGFLNREEAEDVVRVPLGRLGIACDDTAVARAMRLTGGHPYFLQLLGYRIVECCVEAGEGAARTGIVEQAADAVVEQGDIHLRYLWESAGPAGQPVVRALSESESGMNIEELQDRTVMRPQAVSEGLRRLIASELVAQDGDRYTLRVGLLRRWVRNAKPTDCRAD